MPTWPSTLPQRLHTSGFQISAPDGAIRSETSTGKPYQRQRFTAAVQPFSGRIYVDASQYETLINFWKNALGHGALEFDWVHPITQSPATVRFNASEPPQVSATSGEIFAVQLSLELIP